MREVEITVTDRPNGWLSVMGCDTATGIMHGRRADDAETRRQAVRDWFASDEFRRFAAAGGIKV